MTKTKKEKNQALRALKIPKPMRRLWVRRSDGYHGRDARILAALGI